MDGIDRCAASLPLPAVLYLRGAAVVAVRVLAAAATPDGPNLATADVELDHRLIVKGVRIVDSWGDGHPLGMAPLRDDDPRRPVFTWSHNVGRQIAEAVMLQLGQPMYDRERAA